MTDISSPRRLFFGKLSIILLLIVILLPTFAIYSQLAGHEFVTLDDSLYVSGNPHVKSGLNLENVIWAFQTLEAEFWHPLTWLSYMLDTEIYGIGPGGYLLTNLLLHLFNSVMVFICFRRFTGCLWESWLIGVIFALHPLHVEPVAWVSGRKELLCASFWLLSMLAYGAYSRRPGWQRYLAVMTFFVLGLMAKPMIVTLPFVLLLLDFWPLCRDGVGSPDAGTGKHHLSRWRSLVIEKIPLFVISAGSIIITLVAQQRGGGLMSTEELSLSSRFFHSLTAYAVYLKKTIWPGALTPLTPPPADIGGMLVTAAVLILLIITVIVICRTPRQQYLFTGWFWFLGTLVPVIGIVKVGDFFVADRYMYMPLTGVLIIVVFSLKALIDRLSHRLIWMIIIPALIAGVYAPATSFQIQTWRNSETLYAYALAVTENNFLAHHALGNILASRKDKAGAIEHFSRAAAIRPDKTVLWIALGKALVFDSQWTEAEAAFTRAADLRPEHPAPRFYMGCIRAARGEMAGSLAFLVECLGKARQEAPHVDSAYLKIMDFYQNGLYYETHGKAPVARQYYLKALTLINVDVSQRQLSRLVVGGYDKWLTEIPAVQRGPD